MDYDSGSHIYSDHGIRIPSVTQILNPPESKRWYTHGSAERGTEAHELCAKWAQNPKDWPKENYVDSFAWWVMDNDPQWLKIESMVEGEIDGYRFAGRLDGFAAIRGETTVIDWKTGKKARYHHAQVAAYSLVEKPARALVLYLYRSGQYTEDWLSASQLADGIQDFRRAIKEWYEENVQ